MKHIMRLLVVIVIVFIGVLIYPMVFRSKWQYEHSCNDASSFPREFMWAAKLYKERDYADLGGVYPVGNDPSVLNNGKLCGLYYEINNLTEQVSLISIRDAGKDYRSSDDPTSNVGTYIPSILKDGKIELLPEVTFKREPWVWWHALMKFYSDGDKVIPYDQAYSKDHFAIVIFPTVKDEGLMTYIMNEDGTIYEKEFEDPGYIDTYPGPDPTANGWKISK